MDKEIIRRLSSWSKGIKENPYGIELSPTLKCNINCMFCWRRGKEKIEYGTEISTEKYLEIISEAGEMDVREIKIIGGGESTTRKDIFEIMHAVKQQKMHGYICSNGTMFDDRSAEMLVRDRWDHIKISFHGSKELHDELTGVAGSYDRVMKGISSINYYKKKNNAHVPYLEFGFVMVNKNYRDVPNVIKLAHKSGVGSVFIEPITVYSETGEKLKMDSAEEKEFSSIAKRANEASERYGISTNLAQFFSGSLIENTNVMHKVIMPDKKEKDPFLSLPCYEPFYRMGIRADGTVCPCGFFDESSTENIKDNTLREVWFGSYFEGRRRQMTESRLSPYCSKCCTTLVSNNLHLREELKKIGR